MNDHIAHLAYPLSKHSCSITFNIFLIINPDGRFTLLIFISLPNSVGTAPGVKIKEQTTEIYILPGVPTEMKSIFRNIITPLLKEKKGKFIERGFLFSGIGESQIASYTSELENKYPQLWIKTHPRIGLSVEVEVSVTAFNVENGENLVDEALIEIKKIIKNLNGKLKERD